MKLMALLFLVPTLCFAELAAVRTQDKLYAWNESGARVVDMDSRNIRNMVSVENRLALLDNFGALTILDENAGVILTQTNVRNYKITQNHMSVYSLTGELTVYNGKGQKLFGARNVQRYGMSDTMIAYESSGNFFVRDMNGLEIWSGFGLSQMAVSNNFVALRENDDVKILNREGELLTHVANVFEVQISDNFAYVRECSDFVQLIGAQGQTIISGYSIDLLDLTESLALVVETGRFKIFNQSGEVTFDDFIPASVQAVGGFVSVVDRVGTLTLLDGVKGQVVYRLSKATAIGVSDTHALVKTSPYSVSVIDFNGREVRRFNTLGSETVQVSASFIAVKNSTANQFELYGINGKEITSVLQIREFVLPVSQEKTLPRFF